MADNVRHPEHYAEYCSVECIDIIRLVLGDDGFRAFCLGNAIKYLWRHKYKGGSEDLDKAEVYLDWLDRLEDDEPTKYSDRLAVARLMRIKAMGDYK